jgi:magnesium chelatase family protein
VSPRQIGRYCVISAECERLLDGAVGRLGLNARAHDGILKLALTIADLEGAASTAVPHISEAIQYRSLHRNHWA